MSEVARMGERELTPRRLFAVRLAELLELAADLPVKSLVGEVNRRRPAGRGRPVSGPRISDWKRGRHLPESEAAFLVMVQVLVEHCRRLRVPPGQVSAGLLDEKQWRRWLREARSSPPDPVVVEPVGAKRAPAETNGTKDAPAEANEAKEAAAEANEAAEAAELVHRWAGGCPYPGLAAFEQDQARVFFGRERLTAQLVDALANRLDRPGILVVAGASGAGKSSLVHAGLLPALAGGGLSAESAGWPVAVLHPTATPCDELARVLAAVAGADPAPIRQELRGAPQQAHTVVRDAVVTRARARALAGGPATSSGERLVLVVDPFERVFTLPEDAESGGAGWAEGQRADFIAALHAAATRPCGPDGEPAALVIVVVRSDFLTDCAAYPQLADAVRDGLFLVGPMSGPELRLALTGPAEQAGVEISPALVDTILGDLPASAGEGRYELGALPLLSEAMRVTWKHREGDRLTSRSYGLSGGVAHAIQTSAETVYTALPARRQAVARQVFHRLTKLTADGRAVRRPMPYQRRPVPQPGTLAPVGAGRPAEQQEGIDRCDVEQVVEAFAAQRLIVVSEQTAEITHDSLLHAWPRLAGWLRQDPADQALYHRLLEDAEDWARNQRRASFLYHGERLTSVLDARPHWQAHPDRYPALPETARGFLDAAITARKRATLLRRTVTAALAVLLVVALGAAGIAIEAQRDTSGQRDVALSRRLAARSELLTGGDPALSALLAATAWRISPTPEARAAMLNILSRPQRAVLASPFRPISAVAFGSDGRTVATIGDGLTRLWDAKTRKLIGTSLPGYKGWVSSMAFSPDRRTLAIGDNGTVRLWDVTTRTPLGGPFTAGENAVTSLCFSPDGKTLATGGFHGTVRLWDAATRTAIGAPLTAHKDAVTALSFSPDGQTLATGGFHGTVRLWDAATRTAIGGPLTGHTKAVTAISFSADRQLLASSGLDGVARLWQVRTRTPIKLPLPVHPRGDFSIAFSPRAPSILAIGGGDGTVRLWDTATRTPIGTPLTGHINRVASIAFGPDGRTLVTTGEDRTVRLWDVRPHTSIGTPRTDHPDLGTSVAFSPDGQTLATGGGDGAVRLWDTATRTPIGTPLTGHTDAITSIAFGPDSRTLATSSFDGTARVWNTRTGRVVGAPLAGHTYLATSVAFSSDGQTVATSGKDGSARLWDARTGEPISAPLVDSEYNTWSVLSPDGQILASISREGTVRLWQVKTRTPIGAPLAGHTNRATSVAFSPDGQTLATGGEDGTVRLWQVKTHTPIGAPLAGHTDAITSITFSRNGQTLATSGTDGTVRLWDTATSTPIGAPLAGHTNRVTSLAFSPDGQTLATSSDDGTTRLWDVGMPKNLLAAVCAIPTRPFTRTEWAQYVSEVNYRPVCP
ncbi:NACHT and WD repeat domain-containing protein [Sphaerisporangium dianthi]|uniref:NACHT and WD repeat domain-containing protein n=1 Tax=Sphaerisporangium dianthi TaxID=1436120 RepID=A0ABV9CKN4_9ACTN